MFASMLTSAAPYVDGALGFGIKEEQLTSLTRDHNYSALQQYGGASNSGVIAISHVFVIVSAL